MGVSQEFGRKIGGGAAAHHGCAGSFIFSRVDRIHDATNTRHQKHGAHPEFIISQYSRLHILATNDFKIDVGRDHQSSPAPLGLKAGDSSLPQDTTNEIALSIMFLPGASGQALPTCLAHDDYGHTCTKALFCT